ncbi:YSIRK-type signal peptide-containing protein [Dolosigranulum pigrum]|uniref:YSIRK-type signal peptide-containing protein n=1 Tax=Dolosigranulum pigrum TaxID=29394 RepID=UPI0015ECA6DF|nr:YSIRK-type signal peptide-containing protein [Dolosigranulum pigrum]
MTGKNNVYVRMNRHTDRAQRFTLKKLSVGVASVAVGATLLLAPAELVSAQVENEELGQDDDQLPEEQPTSEIIEEVSINELTENIDAHALVEDTNYFENFEEVAIDSEANVEISEDESPLEVKDPKLDSEEVYEEEINNEYEKYSGTRHYNITFYDFDNLTQLKYESDIFNNFTDAKTSLLSKIPFNRYLLHWEYEVKSYAIEFKAYVSREKDTKIPQPFNYKEYELLTDKNKTLQELEKFASQYLTVEQVEMFTNQIEESKNYNELSNLISDMRYFNDKQKSVGRPIEQPIEQPELPIEDSDNTVVPTPNNPSQSYIGNTEENQNFSPYELVVNVNGHKIYQNTLSINELDNRIDQNIQFIVKNKYLVDLNKYNFSGIEVNETTRTIYANYAESNEYKFQFINLDNSRQSDNQRLGTYYSYENAERAFLNAISGQNVKYWLFNEHNKSFSAYTDADVSEHMDFGKNNEVIEEAPNHKSEQLVEVPETTSKPYRFKVVDYDNANIIETRFMNFDSFEEANKGFLSSLPTDKYIIHRDYNENIDWNEFVAYVSEEDITPTSFNYERQRFKNRQKELIKFLNELGKQYLTTEQVEQFTQLINNKTEILELDNIQSDLKLINSEQNPEKLLLIKESEFNINNPGTEESGMYTFMVYTQNKNGFVSYDTRYFYTYEEAERAFLNFIEDETILSWSFDSAEKKFEAKNNQLKIDVEVLDENNSIIGRAELPNVYNYKEAEENFLEFIKYTEISHWTFDEERATFIIKDKLINGNKWYGFGFVDISVMGYGFGDDSLGHYILGQFENDELAKEAFLKATHNFNIKFLNLSNRLFSGFADLGINDIYTFTSDNNSVFEPLENMAYATYNMAKESFVLTIDDYNYSHWDFNPETNTFTVYNISEKGKLATYEMDFIDVDELWVVKHEYGEYISPDKAREDLLDRTPFNHYVLRTDYDEINRRFTVYLSRHEGTEISEDFTLESALLNRRKIDALRTLNESEYLTKEQVETFTQQISSSEHEGEVQHLIFNIQNENAQKQHLQNSKFNAFEDIERLLSQYLTAEQVEKFAEQIENAETETAIREIVDDARYFSNQQRPVGEETSLYEAKIQLHDEIRSRYESYLLRDQLIDFAEKINQAESIEKLDSIRNTLHELTYSHNYRFEVYDFEGKRDYRHNQYHRESLGNYYNYEFKNVKQKFLDRINKLDVDTWTFDSDTRTFKVTLNREPREYRMEFIDVDNLNIIRNESDSFMFTDEAKDTLISRIPLNRYILRTDYDEDNRQFIVYISRHENMEISEDFTLASARLNRKKEEMLSAVQEFEFMTEEQRTNYLEEVKASDSIHSINDIYYKYYRKKELYNDKFRAYEEIERYLGQYLTTDQVEKFSEQIERSASSDEIWEIVRDARYFNEKQIPSNEVVSLVNRREDIHRSLEGQHNLSIDQLIVYAERINQAQSIGELEVIREEFDHLNDNQARANTNESVNYYVEYIDIDDLEMIRATEVRVGVGERLKDSQTKEHLPLNRHLISVRHKENSREIIAFVSRHADTNVPDNFDLGVARLNRQKEEALQLTTQLRYLTSSQVELFSRQIKETNSESIISGIISDMYYFNDYQRSDISNSVDIPEQTEITESIVEKTEVEQLKAPKFKPLKLTVYVNGQLVAETDYQFDSLEEIDQADILAGYINDERYYQLTNLDNAVVNHTRIVRYNFITVPRTLEQADNSELSEYKKAVIQQLQDANILIAPLYDTIRAATTKKDLDRLVEVVFPKVTEEVENPSEDNIGESLDKTEKPLGENTVSEAVEEPIIEENQDVSTEMTEDILKEKPESLEESEDAREDTTEEKTEEELESKEDISSENIGDTEISSEAEGSSVNIEAELAFEESLEGKEEPLESDIEKNPDIHLKPEVDHPVIEEFEAEEILDKLDSIEANFVFTLPDDSAHHGSLGKFESLEQAEKRIRHFANQQGYTLQNFKIENGIFIATVTETERKYLVNQ